MEKKLNQVKNNQEKAQSYKNQVERYNLAMQNEFYLEAINIVYAMCEDRINSFLYHSGFVCDRELNISDENRKILCKILNIKELKKCDLYTINTKIEYIKKLIKWANESIGYENEFEKKLKDSIVGNIDVDAEIEYLKDLKNWIKKRNPIIHGLLNKSSDGLDLYLKECAEEGYSIVRKLDSEDRKLKR